MSRSIVSPPLALGFALLVSAVPPLVAQLDESELAPAALAECRRTLETAWQEVERLEDRVAELERAGGSADVAALEEALAKRNAVLARLKDALVAQRARVKELQAELAEAQRAPDLSDRVAELEQELQDALARQVPDLSGRVAELEEELRQAEAARAEQAREIAALEQAAASAAPDEASQERIAELESLLQSAEDRFTDQANELARVKEELAAIRDEARAGAAEGLTPGEEAFVSAMASTDVASGRDAGASEDPFRRIAAGHRALRDNQLVEAERIFAGVVESNPGLVEARLGMAQVLYMQGEFRAAGETVAAILEQDPNNAQALGIAGILAWQDGNLNRAQRRLERAIRFEPNDAQLYNYLAVVHQGMNRPSRALAAVEKAVEIEPDNPEYLFNLAVLQAVGDPPDLDAARRNYERALELGTARDEELEQQLYR